MRQPLNILKTTASLSGTLLMMGGTAVFTELSLLDYFNVKNKPARITVGILTFSSMSYVLIFSRGLSLWKYYSRPSSANPTEIIPIDRRMNTFGYTIGVLGAISTIAYFFFSSYLASKTLLASVKVNEPIPQAAVFVYIWSSMVVVYLNFALPKAINNAKDIAGLVFLRDRSDQPQTLRHKALAKTVAATMLGTLSFGGLVLFFTQNAIQSMPVARDFSHNSQEGISVGLLISAAMMYALAKSLESYQYFSKQRHFNHATTPIAAHSTRARLLLRTHQVVGGCYLLVELCAFYRSNLNLLQNLGADIELKTNHIPFFVIALLCALSSAFIEYVFSYQNMMQLTQQQLPSWRFFNTHPPEATMLAALANEADPAMTTPELLEPETAHPSP